MLSAFARSVEDGSSLRSWYRSSMCGRSRCCTTSPSSLTAPAPQVLVMRINGYVDSKCQRVCAVQHRVPWWTTETCRCLLVLYVMSDLSSAAPCTQPNTLAGCCGCIVSSCMIVCGGFARACVCAQSPPSLPPPSPFRRLLPSSPPSVVALRLLFFSLDHTSRCVLYARVCAIVYVHYSV